MALELIYTSAIRGLRAGTSGFCTVAMTKGMPPALVPRLEALGGYRAGPSGQSPHAHCFWRVETPTGIAHVLSIVGPAPPDHTARSNKIATYVVLAPDELVAAGPAWLLSQPGLLRSSWSGEAAWIDTPVRVPTTRDVGPRPCTAWQAATGDAGWAGVLASAFLRDQARPIHVIYGAATEPLPLVEEAIRLLPEWARWRATFSTYFLQPVAGTPCAWRFCLEGTPAADVARQSKGLVIDTTRAAGLAPDSKFTRMARTGVDEELVAAQKAARSAARPSGTGVASVGKVARPVDAPIELADDAAGELPNTPRRRVLEFDADEGSESSESPRRANNSAVLALVAAALTLLLLTLVFILTTYAGKTPPTPATPATIDTPVASEKPKRELEPLHLKAGVDDSPSVNPRKDSVDSTLNPPKDDVGNGDLDTSSGTKAAVIAPDAIMEQPAEAVSMDPKEPAETPESEMPTVPDAPVAPAAPAAPPVPAAPIAPAIPVAVAPLVMPTIAKWAAVSAFETFTVGSVQLRLHVDIGEGSGRTARFVSSKSLASADVKVMPSGGIEFGRPTISAKPSIEGSQLVVTGFASGSVPETLKVALTGAGDETSDNFNAVAALQLALERCTVEVFDKGGKSLGLVQLRAKSTKPLIVGDSKNMLFADLGDSPIDVQVTAPSQSSSTIRVRQMQSQTVNIADNLTLSVNRAVEKSSTSLRAEALSGSAPGIQRTTLATELQQLAARKRSCGVVRAFANGGLRPRDFDQDLQAVQNALLPEEQAKFLGNNGQSLLITDNAVMRQMVDTVLPRIESDLDRVSKLLNETKAAGQGKPSTPQWRIRVSNEDGVVLLDSAITQRGGKQ